MSKYTDEERQAILDAARNTLKRGFQHSPERRAANEVERLLTPEPVRPERKLDTAPVDWELRIQQAIAAEHALIMEVLVETLAEVRIMFMDEIEQDYAKQFNMVRLDIDALRHEIMKFAGAGVIELPSNFTIRGSSLGA
jgi:hypothetical protein